MQSWGEEEGLQGLSGDGERANSKVKIQISKCKVGGKKGRRGRITGYFQKSLREFGLGMYNFS